MADITPTKRFRLTAAAIIRNEGPYLAEWIEYHGLIGVEHFYLYDNGSSDDTFALLRDYIIQGRVTLLIWPEYPGQTSAYNHAVKVFGRDSEWMALIDLDEYLHYDADGTVPDFLAGMTDSDQILLPWMHFDSNGHDEKPDALIIEAYTRRAETAHLQPKAIVRPDAVLWAEIHHCVTRQGRTTDPAGRPMAERWICDQPPEGPLRLNHYFTKSRAEFSAKVARGQAGGGKGKTMAAFTRFDCPVEDRSAAEIGRAVRAALAETRARPGQPRVHAPWSAQSELTPSRFWTLRARSVLKDMWAALPADAVLKTRAEIALEQISVQGNVLFPALQAFEALRIEVAAQILSVLEADSRRTTNSDFLGRPYVAIAGRCSVDTEVEITVEGLDAGRKPIIAQQRIILPEGTNMTFAILSGRTMTVDRVHMRADSPIADLQAEVCSFR